VGPVGPVVPVGPVDELAHGVIVTDGATPDGAVPNVAPAGPKLDPPPPPPLLLLGRPSR